MPGRVQIRNFSSDEWPLYRDLRLRALADSPDAFGRTWAEEQIRPDEEWSNRLSEWTTSRDCHCLVALSDEKPAGLLLSRIERTRRDIAHLYSMWVDSNARGSGIGRLLVESAIQWASNRHASAMVLRVTETNLSARRLYVSCGFRDLPERTPLREGSPLFAIGMERKL